MNFGNKISLLVLFGVLSSEFTFPPEASAQSRLVHIPKLKEIDRTHEMPLRAVQSGKLNIKNLNNFCDNPSSVKLTKKSSELAINPRYVGGERSPDCVFRDLVKITFLNSLGKKARCTGILLRKNLVLTAAHCTCGKLGSYRIDRRMDRLFNEKKNIKPHINEYVLDAPPVRYNNFSCTLSPELQPGRDLAVLSIENRRDYQKRSSSQKPKLLKKENYTRGVYIADMAKIYRDKDRPQLLVGAGYGQTEDGTLPDHLRYAAVHIASFFCGQYRLAASNCMAFKEFVLADRLGGSGPQRSDSCNGDSGGPIFYQAPQRLLSNQDKVDESTPNVKNVVMLVGIASRALRGVRHNQGTLCGGGGIYTAVGHPDVIAWLRTFGVNPLNVFNYDFRSAKP